MTSLQDELIRRLEAEIQPLPTRPCINAENHLFGSCFACEKTKGHNEAINDAIYLVRELYSEKDGIT